MSTGWNKRYLGSRFINETYLHAGTLFMQVPILNFLPVATSYFNTRARHILLILAGRAIIASRAIIALNFLSCKFRESLNKNFSFPPTYFDFFFFFRVACKNSVYN